MLSRLSRPRALILSAVPLVALFGVVGFAPLPYVIAQPGDTANVLGTHKGTPVISISGAPVRTPEGALRMTTILATGPAADIRVGEVVDGWFRTDRSVLPRDSVYPSGKSTGEVAERNLKDMTESQHDATLAALAYLDEDPAKVKVTLRLADIGGPSAGLLFSLGIVDKLDGNGEGGDLTGGRSIAGTGTISPNGKVGQVGGVSLKTQAAARDGATVFLVPEGECSDALAEAPKELRLIPVTSLQGAVESLRALDAGGKVPSC
ncbi:S16 family serine protease [Streptomyces sp. NBC_00690]|uniref:S16 family serine protease n=1 Tax=Streptomyces sp. NBC_00690 TaxID=2975808 RepID=UPI002E29E147|nr:S16 family serine protease [Streptomyces sp. NBC_00690]